MALVTVGLTCDQPVCDLRAERLAKCAVTSEIAQPKSNVDRSTVHRIIFYQSTYIFSGENNFIHHQPLHADLFSSRSIIHVPAHTVQRFVRVPLAMVVGWVAPHCTSVRCPGNFYRLMATDAAERRAALAEHLRFAQAARERFAASTVEHLAVPAPRPPAQSASPQAPEPPPAALCPSCGNCTRAERCEGCGYDMSEALALWRGTGITPEGLPVADPAEPVAEPAPPPGQPSSTNRAPATMGTTEEVESIFSMLRPDENIAASAAASAATPASLATPPEVLDALPCTVLQADVPDAQECQVCLLPLVAGDTVLRLPCFHCYHQACIVPWLQRHRSCPVCKHDVCAQPPLEPSWQQAPALSASQKTCSSDS